MTALVGSAALTSLGQPISVPNYSFESQPAPNTFPYVNPMVDAWQKNPEPAFYQPAFGAYGIPWAGTAGVFLDVNPYVNRDGSQAGYLLAAPQVALFQDYSVSPAFNAIYEVGQSYSMTLGVFGKSSLAPGSTLELSLYYRDGQDNRVTVGSTTIAYDAAVFPSSGPLSLVDFSVNVPAVQATDPWANRNIGIQIASTVPIEQTSFGNWDFDNLRLTAIPEPNSLSLLVLGVCSAFVMRSRSRRSA